MEADKNETIIFIDSDEISLFVAEEILSAKKRSNSVHYFSEATEAMDFILTLSPSSKTSITLFVNTASLLREKDLMRKMKNSLLAFPSRACLLTSLEGVEKREKEFIQEMGISCFIDKPLTEEKLLQVLDPSVVS